MVSEGLNRQYEAWLGRGWTWITIAGGVALGLMTAFLARLSVIWAALLVIGLLIAVCSLAARDAKTFWFVIFALVLPLEIKKMLIDSSYVVEAVKQYGFPTGELPGPVLHLSDLPLTMLLLLWSADLMLRRQPIRFPKAHWFAVALLGWSALSIVGARDVAAGVFDLFRGIKLYLLYILAYNTLGDPRRLRWLLVALFAGVALQGMLCLTQFISQDIGRLFTTLLGKKDLYSADLRNTVEGMMKISEGGIAGKRASGTVGAINAQAFYFEQLVPLALLCWLALRQPLARYAGLLAAVLGGLGLVVTFSRGGLLGLFSGVLCLVVLAWICNAVPRQHLALLAIAGLLAMAAALPLVTRFFTTRPEGATARIHLLGVGLNMVRDHPVLGVGLNNHLQAKPDYDPRSYAFQMPTHNHFVLVATQVGIPGMLFFLCFLGSIWWSAMRAAGSDDPFVAVVAIGTAATLVAIVVHCQFDYIATHTSLTLIWLFAGIVAALQDRAAASGGPSANAPAPRAIHV